MAREQPVAQAHLRVALQRLGNAEARAGNALVVQLATALHVGQRRVRKHELARGEGGLHALRGIHARAKKGDLKAPQPLVGLRMAGDVPPLGAQIGVAAVVAREGQRARRQGPGGSSPAAGSTAQRALGRECQQRAAPDHQASSACSRVCAAAQSPRQRCTQASSW